MKISKEKINEISKVFDIQYIGNSRIDGYPYFKIKKDKFEIYDMKHYFDIEHVPLLEDNIVSFPSGERECFILKISNIKSNFYKLIRKEKLIKINLSV